MEEMYYVGFSHFPGIGPVKFGQLLKTFGSAGAAWKAEEKAAVDALGEITGQKFLNFRKTFPLEKCLADLKKKKIHCIFLGSPEYPKLLENIPKAPYVLYLKGNKLLLKEEKIIGVVGTRKVTDYGRHVTESLTTDLVQKGFIIVSGLAFGVDAIAHRTTLACHGSTIAVLGSGVDFCTPREHQRLYDEILENNGAIISGFIPGEGAGIGSFPARNRIVAGISQGILVTEGAADSGALITANFAKEFGRPVFAVPGPITSDVSKGTNNLLRQQAIAVSSGYDIMQSLQNVIPNVFRDLSEGKMLKQPKATSYTVAAQVQHDKTIQGDTPEEQMVLDVLQKQPLHFDDIVRKMNTDSKAIGSLLSLMELKGMVKILSDGRYMLN